MHFRCKTKALADSLAVASRAVSGKAVQPALEGILLRADGETISLTAYDLEIGIFTQLPAQILEPGEIVLSARVFSDIIRRLAGETVEVKADEKLLTNITSGQAEFTILGIPPADFPELPAAEGGAAFSIAEPLLAGMIRQTLFAVSADETNPVHTGTLFELKDRTLRLISVDGFRLAIRTEPVDIDEALSFVVPGKTLGELQKLLHTEGDDTLSVTMDEKYVLFKVGTFTLLSRLLEGQFLDYRTVTNGVQTAELRVKTRAFSDSIERASLLITDRLKSPVRCIFETDRIRVKCASSIGKVYDEVPAALTGEGCEMGFNNRYLSDALKAADCDEVRVQLGGPLSPMKIYPPEGESFLFLVLPVRLQSDV